MLQTTDLPVASVAVQTGYTTPGYFSRLYKKYKGVSPEAERRGSKS
ncbi:MAG: helix-turn-helix domain-containing protein [Flavonifractor plautii]